MKYPCLHVHIRIFLRSGIIFWTGFPIKPLRIFHLALFYSGFKASEHDPDPAHHSLAFASTRQDGCKRTTPFLSLEGNELPGARTQDANLPTTDLVEEKVRSLEAYAIRFDGMRRKKAQLHMVLTSDIGAIAISRMKVK